MKLLITGGCGFIGSHLIRFLLKKYPNYQIVNLDKINYLINPDNLKQLDEFSNNDNYTLIKGNIFDRLLVEAIFKAHKFDAVIHLAAESFVDKSIEGPIEFLNSNVVGTVNLLESFRIFVDYKNNPKSRFYYVSTDEVYGSLEEVNDYLFTEESNFAPRNPYAASKTSGDIFIKAYSTTYNMPTLISRCSNNYGPYQYEEKLIPKTIFNAINNNDIIIYDKGDNVREWLYVNDHVNAISTIFHNATPNSVYNIGSRIEKSNIEIVHTLCDLVDEKIGRKVGTSRNLIKFVMNARPGHDFRYALNIDKIKKDLGWRPLVDFNEGIESTVTWYVEKFLPYKNAISLC